jgi:hypothetical protein
MLNTNPTRRLSFHSLKAPADYNRLIVFPARTPDGEANVCYEHVEGKTSSLTLHCDTATGQVSIRDSISQNRVRNEDEYLVIMAGEAVTEQTSKTLQEWQSQSSLLNKFRSKKDTGHCHHSKHEENWLCRRRSLKTKERRKTFNTNRSAKQYHSSIAENSSFRFIIFVSSSFSSSFSFSFFFFFASSSSF